MQIKSIILVSAFLIIFSVLYPGAIREEAEEVKPIIRMDLLKNIEKDLAPASRNIFSQYSTGSGSMDVGIPGRRRPGQKTEEEEQGEELSLNQLNLRYIGYVHSGERIVGLIIYEGEPMAVKEGELIADDYKVGMIAEGQVEIIGPGSETKLYFFEGE